MHCPDCGQQQISDEIRFCSRCGFPLAVVSQIVAGRGTIPGLSEASEKPRWLTRKKGIFFGVVWMLFFLLMIAGLLDELKAPGEIVSAAAIFGVFSGIVIIVASAMFLEREHRAYPDTSHDPYGKSGHSGQSGQSGHSGLRRHEMSAGALLKLCRRRNPCPRKTTSNLGRKTAGTRTNWSNQASPKARPDYYEKRNDKRFGILDL